MPLYEFVCPRCGHVTETIQSYADASPQCEGCDAATKRRVSRSSFLLKGDGWAKDNYGIQAPEPKTPAGE